MIVAALPALAGVLALPEAFHVWMVALAVPTSGVALVSSGSGPRNGVTLLIGVTGLTAMATGALVVGRTRHETVLTVGGALLVAVAHVRNWRHRRGCR